MKYQKHIFALLSVAFDKFGNFGSFSTKLDIFFVLLQAFDSLYRSAYPNVKKQTCHIDFDRVDRGRYTTTLARQGR